MIKEFRCRVIADTRQNATVRPQHGTLGHRFQGRKLPLTESRHVAGDVNGWAYRHRPEFSSFFALDDPYKVCSLSQECSNCRISDVVDDGLLVLVQADPDETSATNEH